MGLEPEDQRHPTRRHVQRGALLLVAAAAAAGGWAALDQAGALLYRRLKPWAELQAGRAMGHPLVLGPYRGLRPWGITAGPSRFWPGPDNPSTISAAGVALGFDPLASALQRSWVLSLQVRGAQVQLQRNRRGSYWSLGQVPPGRQPPRLVLQIHLDGPARLRVQPPQGSPQLLVLRGRSSLELHRRRIAVQGRLQPEAGGSLDFNAAWQWQQRQWQLQLKPQRLSLGLLQPFLPQLLQGPLQGKVQGHLSLRPERCAGALSLDAVRWQLPRLAQPLQADRLELQCQRRSQRLQLASGSLALGAWRGRIQGSLPLADQPGATVALRLQARNAGGTDRLVAGLNGPWRRLVLQLQGSFRGRALGPLPPGRLDLQARVVLRPQPRMSAELQRLVLQRGGSRLQASGRLWPQLNLRSEAVSLGPDLLRQAPALANLLGPRPQLDAQLRWPSLRLRQRNNPLVGAVDAQLSWRSGLLRLERFSADGLRASGELPLRWRRGGGLQAGALLLRIDLQRYSLARLSPLIGARLRGSLDAWGTVEGPLNLLRPQLGLLVREPGVGPIWLREVWRGRLDPVATDGAALQLQALQPAPVGHLQARLDRRWLPSLVRLQRSEGVLQLAGDPRRYRWQVAGLPLQGLELGLGAEPRFQPLQGALSGAGWLDLQPLWMAGSVRVERPRWLGVGGRRLQARGEYRRNRFQLKGQWLPEPTGTVAIQLRGQRGGALWTRVEGRGLDARLLPELAAAVPRWRGTAPAPQGLAADLGLLAINTLGASLSEQLQALAEAQRRLAQQASGGRDPLRRLEQLQGVFDADLSLNGPRLDRLQVNLEARGHLWLEQQDRDLALTGEPLVARLRGPLQGGEGQFSLQQLPLTLVALLAPVPDGLRGGLSAEGRYSLRRRRPDLDCNLSLSDAWLKDQPLRLERGGVSLEGDALLLDWALRSGDAANSVDLRGRLPLQAEADGLELRVASRGDGLRFLSVLGGRGARWQQGSADLQLLVRGSRAKPVANGFLRFREGVLELAGQTIRDLEATLLFDFEELELQQLSARVGRQGVISGTGQLALLSPAEEAPRLLQLQLRQVPFRLPRMQAEAEGTLLVSGALVQPVLGGELQLSRGSINVQPGQLATEADAPRPVSVPELLEAKWDFRQPLVVMGQQMESTASRDLRDAVPRLGLIGLDQLRLRLGPDLKVTVPNVLNFNTAGLLTLNGRLDPSLRASGVVRLLRGRLGLFTTTFSLDPDAPNVAVFTPSLGLIPYLDIALRTRVSDTLSATGGLAPASIYDWNQTSSFSPIDQLRLVRVRLEVSGPADRLAQNLRLTSSPPLSEERLVALIGGNSLVGLVGGNAGAALATVLGQSLLGPVVGGLSDAFGQRLSFALYPTYFAPAEALARENRSRRLPSQLVLGSEIGLDVSERFNVSVLAAPNRSDIPPQVTLRYQASDRLGVQTSIDTEGRWQSQLQLFFRF